MIDSYSIDELIYYNSSASLIFLNDQFLLLVSFILFSIPTFLYCARAFNICRKRIFEGEDSTFHSSSSSSTPFYPNNISPLTLPISPTRLSDVSHNLFTLPNSLNFEDVWSIGWEDGNSVKSNKEKKPPPRPGPPSKEAIEILKVKRKNNEKEGIRDVSPMVRPSHIYDENTSIRNLEIR